MLHIILGILKVIGIVIGILLLLVLAAVMALVFVPVRYQVEVVRQAERTGGKVRVSWLLRIISVAVSADLPGKPEIAVRLFGIRLPLFGAAKPGEKGGGVGGGKSQGKKKAGAAEEGKPRAAEENVPAVSAGIQPPPEVHEAPESAEDDDASVRETEKSPVKAERSAGSAEQDVPAVSAGIQPPEVHEELDEAEDDDPRAWDVQEPDPEEDRPASDGLESGSAAAWESESADGWKNKSVGSRESEPAADWESESANGRESEPVDGREGEPAAGGSDAQERVRSLFEKLFEKYEAVRGKAGALGRKLTSLGERAAELAEKIRTLARKPGELLEMAEKYEAKAIFGDLWGNLLLLLRHYRPRRISGYLRFGTGDPASTGQLTGLVYLLLPSCADSFTVTPEFYDAAFETELTCSGHIRALHVLRVGWRAIRDKKLRRLIKALRKKGES